MKRRLIALILSSLMAAVSLAGCSNKSSNENIVEEREVVIDEEVSLDFPKDDFTVETVTVKTSQGDKEVTYNYYTHLCYASKPVNADYQSLNVKVPVSINGVGIDASNAPILFKNSVGGYMSAINSDNPEKQNTFAEDIIKKGSKDKDSKVINNADLALASGYVVVEPGCRGRDNQFGDGTYYGKAPAAIVDLKAAVRYLRHNKGVMPGNTDWIISTGVGAGGALSALLGTSGNSSMYEHYLKDIGAANEADNIFASADFCPITDLEHADMAYEWMYGKVPLSTGKLAEQDISNSLRDSFVLYQNSLNLKGRGDFGNITANNYRDYLLTYYVKPSADKFLKSLSEEERTAYLNNNSWITWNDDSSYFTFEDFVQHVGRDKNIPAFDDFNLTLPENILFGDTDTNAKHFTAFSADRNTAEGGNTVIDDSLRNNINLMNPMYFVKMDNIKCADYWWIRQGSSDSNTSLTVLSNLATALENKGKNVNTLLYWDAGHGADEDSEDFMKWIGDITGYSIE